MALRVSGVVALEHLSPFEKRPGCKSQSLSFYSGVGVSYDPLKLIKILLNLDNKALLVVSVDKSFQTFSSLCTNCFLVLIVLYVNTITAVMVVISR